MAIKIKDGVDPCPKFSESSERSSDRETPPAIAAPIKNGSREKRADTGGDKPIISISRQGRPLHSQTHLTNEATKPWLALGMSRRTWYRRQKEARDGNVR